MTKIFSWDGDQKNFGVNYFYSRSTFLVIFCAYSLPIIYYNNFFSVFIQNLSMATHAEYYSMG